MPVTVAYPGIAPVSPTAPSLREGPATIGAVGRLAPVKGHEYLIAAVKHLQDRGIAVRAEIVGSGPRRAQLEQLAERLGVIESLAFLGWREDVRAHHAHWDVFVAPSLYEGFGLATLEAMGSGLPVVASAVGGLAELVEDGTTGFLVAPRDEHSLADRLHRLLEDEALRTQMGSAGRDRAGAAFTEAGMAEQIASVYDRLLKSTT
jgi:glycosyltransferase involved in cell wall biosynthesis